MKDKFYKNKDGSIQIDENTAMMPLPILYMRETGKNLITGKIVMMDFSKQNKNKNLKEMEDTFLDRLKKEIVELEDKTSKLRAFIGSDLEAYKNASHMQKRLLSMQLSTMHAYLGILELRLMELEEDIKTN